MCLLALRAQAPSVASYTTPPFAATLALHGPVVGFVSNAGCGCTFERYISPLESGTSYTFYSTPPYTKKPGVSAARRRWCQSRRVSWLKHLYALELLTGFYGALLSTAIPVSLPFIGQHALRVNFRACYSRLHKSVNMEIVFCRVHVTDAGGTEGRSEHPGTGTMPNHLRDDPKYAPGPDEARVGGALGVMATGNAHLHLGLYYFCALLYRGTLPLNVPPDFFKSFEQGTRFICLWRKHPRHMYIHLVHVLGPSDLTLTPAEPQVPKVQFAPGPGLGLWLDSDRQEQAEETGESGGSLTL
ncbi:hypothetical protein B0H16DRAFT_1464674 [Mycena metata]|uniref:Uncharacterized protein n=1 Tax=Mycena metata TaxID=1033252 RepID=A0AAD7IE87_9AGAR|nr:hypothetical protein B0H16DRAFT_1464674 [Mycena metata]